MTDQSPQEQEAGVVSDDTEALSEPIGEQAEVVLDEPQSQQDADTEAELDEAATAVAEGEGDLAPVEDDETEVVTDDADGDDAGRHRLEEDN